MMYRFEENEIEIECGDIVKGTDGIYMVAEDSQSNVIIIDLSNGQLRDYGYYDDGNKLCKDIGLRLVCKNDNLILSNNK